VPPTPGTPGPVTPPDPSQPVPPTPPSPGPEIPDLPGSPKPETPEIQEPEQPDRSHQIGFQQRNRTYTAGNAAPDTQREGMSAGPGDEQPDTGNSAQPYDVNAKDNDEYQPGERPEEGRESRTMPREMMDESSVQAQDMIDGSDRSDQKSTDGLDRPYNDPQAAREMAS